MKKTQLVANLQDSSAHAQPRALNQHLKKRIIVVLAKVCVD